MAAPALDFPLQGEPLLLELVLLGRAFLLPPLPLSHATSLPLAQAGQFLFLLPVPLLFCLPQGAGALQVQSQAILDRLLHGRRFGAGALQLP